MPSVTRFAILAKLNMDDGVPGGFWVDEAIQVAQWLEASGSVDALELTMGSSLLNPMYLFKGDAPIREFAAAMPQPVRLGVQLVGKSMLHTYPYKPLFMLEQARQIRAAVKLPLVLLGGVTDKAGMDTAMAEGFEFVAMARALLREPDLINRIAAESISNHCASTATSACPRSSVAPAACWSNASELVSAHHVPTSMRIPGRGP